MYKKYTVEFSIRLRQHSLPEHHFFNTDDPVVCEEFIQDLLEQGMGIHSIKHNGSDLPRPEFDRIVKLAAGSFISKRICASLSIKPEEEHFRFGFAA